MSSSDPLPPHSDYKLPGDILNPVSLRARHQMLRMGYSRRANPRRLESLFYGPWNHLFSALVSDNPNMLVVPQYTVYRDRDDKSPPGSSNVSEDTKAANNIDSRTPDFGLLKVVATPVNADATPPWNDLWIESNFVSLLSELKRPPSRRIVDPERFTDDLYQKIDIAKSDLFRASAILFSNPNLIHQPNSIILVAVSGEWYSWTELPRDQILLPKRFPKDWVDNLRTERKSDIKSSRQNRDKGGQPRLQRNTGARPGDVNKSINDSVNDRKDNSDNVGNDSDEDGEKAGEGVNSREGDDSDETGVSSDEHSGEKEVSREQENCAQDDPDESKQQEDLEGIDNGDDDDERLDTLRGASDSEESDCDTSETEGKTITEFHHRIFDDPGLIQLKTERYQEISSNMKGLIKLARAKWTKPIRLGTAVSNQNLAMIRERLDAIQPKITRPVMPRA